MTDGTEDLAGKAAEISKDAAQNLNMLDTEDYLTRGRRFSALADEAIAANWLKACEGMLTNKHESVDAMDLSTEAELRKLQLPIGALSPEFRRAMEASPPDHRRDLEELIEEFDTTTNYDGVSAVSVEKGA